MPLNYVNLESIIVDWIEDNKLSQELVSMTQLKRWALDVLRDNYTADMLIPKIALLTVKNTKAELPKDFATIISVAYRTYQDKDDCTTIKQISEYTQKSMDGTCEATIKIKCDKCKEKTCTCEDNGGIIEVDIDRIQLMQNPWFTDASRYGRPIDSDELYSDEKYKSQFQLIGYAINPFHNVNYHLPDCVNLRCKDCVHHYAINSLPTIETDITTKDGHAELLVAYLGKPTNSNGDLLVPYVTPMIEAVEYQLSYKHYRSMFSMTGAQSDRILYSEARELRNQAMLQARVELSIPDPDKLRAELSQILNRPRIAAPTRNYSNNSRLRY